MTRPLSSCTIGSGDDPTIVDLSMAHEVHVRARVDLSEHAVDVERIGTEVDVEALREHHLEDVAREDVLLRDLDGALVAVVAHRGLHVGQRLGRIRRRDRRIGQRSSEVVGSVLDACDRGVIRRVDLLRRRRRAQRHALDEVERAAASGRRRRGCRSPRAPRRGGRGRHEARTAGARPRARRRTRGTRRGHRAAGEGRASAGIGRRRAPPRSRASTPSSTRHLGGELTGHLDVPASSRRVSLSVAVRRTRSGSSARRARRTRARTRRRRRPASRMPRRASRGRREARSRPVPP